jgi:FkbM family methyltransferase
MAARAMWGAGYTQVGPRDMAINRKQLLRYTGAAAAGGSLGFLVRGLLCPDPAGTTATKPIEGRVIPPAPPGPAPPPREIIGEESFSQCGEDLVVAFTIAYLGLGPRISYLDVGANDPVRYNNTYYFYRRGHRGVLVEPNGALCRLLREQRRGDTVLEAGIGGSAASEADYYVMSADGLNTFSKEEAEHHVDASKGRISIQEVIKLPLLSINDVMAKHFKGAPTFLSVDTEGLDLAILKSIDYGRFRPKIICAETLVSESKGTRTEIPEFMATRGYAVRGGSFVNTIFVDSKLL